MDPVADFGPVDEGLIVETRKPSEARIATALVLGNEAQESALADLIRHPGRALLYSGYRTADISDREETTIIQAWVSTHGGAAAGLFEIAPDGDVTGSFESTRPPGL